MSSIGQIEKWALAGWNQEDVSQALGISRYKLRIFLKQYPAFKWPIGCSIAHRDRAKSWKPKGNPASVTMLNKARQAALPRYTVRGVTGTRRELIARFAVVSAHTVDVRIQRGWGLEEALFTPKRFKPSEDHKWRELMGKPDEHA